MSDDQDQLERPRAPLSTEAPERAIENALARLVSHASRTLHLVAGDSQPPVEALVEALEDEQKIIDAALTALVDERRVSNAALDAAARSRASTDAGPVTDEAVARLLWAAYADEGRSDRRAWSELDSHKQAAWVRVARAARRLARP